MRIILAAICSVLFVFSYMQVWAVPLENQTVSALGHQIQLQVPTGMRVEFVTALYKPRFIEKGPGGELLIGSRPNGSSSTIYRVPYPYQNAQNLVTLGGYIHSTAYRQGILYAAETGALLQASYGGASSQLSSTDFSQVMPLPSDTGGHSSRTVIAGPNGNLYISLGISGNCSDEYMNYSNFELRRGGVFVLGSGNTLQTYSSGLRNPIGLAFHPQTGELFATNAGSDNLGFDNPPEVLARLSGGSFHGMPWFQYYDGAFRRQDCISTSPPRPSSQAVVPAATFLARSTPEGITFLAGSVLGVQYDTSAAVAIHGSWARSSGGGPETRRPRNFPWLFFQVALQHGLKIW